MKAFATLAVFVSVAALAFPALAQTAPVKAGGVIASVGDGEVTITTKDGPLEVTFGDKTRFSQSVPITLDDIKVGSFIGTAAVTDASGALTALEVTLFPEALRGAGQGNHPYGAPNTSMTNGTVSTVTGTANRTLTVTYDGGQQSVVVPPNVPIVTFAPGDKSLLVVGANIVVRGARGEDGKLKAGGITVGKDGSSPPL